MCKKQTLYALYICRIIKYQYTNRLKAKEGENKLEKSEVELLI